MSYRSSLLVAITFCFLMGCSDKVDTMDGQNEGAIRIHIGQVQYPTGELAVKELKDYFSKIFMDEVETTQEEGQCDVVIGLAEASPLIEQALEKGSISLPTGKNADQGYSIKTIKGCIYLTALTEEGLLYGVYELLEAYGAYYQISGELLPSKTKFTVKNLDICESPVFKYRGLLPWDNFLCGMSGYNYEDYQELIDRATRMKFNMLQFHFYPGLAFFTETLDGKPEDPKFIGEPVDVFYTKGAIGEEAFGGIEVFGCTAYVENIGNPRAQAQACQEIMRKVIDYAHSRGHKTCVGIELMRSSWGDFTYLPQKPNSRLINPLDPYNAEKSVARYRSLVNMYPNSDYYWLWQTEGQWMWNSPVLEEPQGHAEMREKYKHWAGRSDSAGDIDYAYLLREVAKRLRPEERSRLATGGWGVEHLFTGINSDFPEELIFASLNSYNPPLAQDLMPYYRVAQEGRRAWMIEWWEFDGNQWFTQFRAGWQEKMYKQCVEYGVESVTLLGWKLSAVEHNVRYLSEFCWNPQLGASAFYRDYVERIYGKGAEKIAELFESYDEWEPTSPPANPCDYRSMLLAPGWAALPIPQLPGTKEKLNEESWKTTLSRAEDTISQQEILLKIDTEAIAMFRNLLPRFKEEGEFWASLMINRLEFRMLYVKSMLALNRLLLDFDRVGRNEGIEKGKEAARVQAQEAEYFAREAIEKYAADIRNRSDQGLIAQLNEQYYKVIEQFASSLAQ